MQPLDPVEVRVLGSLLEKDITTPEYYPLSLNALVAACNQKNNRDPVVSYDEETAGEALDRLRQRGLAFVRSGAGHRVEKHGHQLGESLNLGRRELALLCTLMLRGPQTLGELRDRSGRMYDFNDLAEVESALQRLAEREPEPLVTQLPRQPGTKEPRWMHRLAGEPATEIAGDTAAAEPTRADRLARLETEIAGLRAQVGALERQFEEFRKQFE